MPEYVSHNGEWVDARRKDPEKPKVEPKVEKKVAPKPIEPKVEEKVVVKQPSTRRKPKKGKTK